MVVNGENPEIGIMSRLIIRNLPNSIKEERIRSIFAAKGELTDVKLCRTKDGKFRRFGFIGYKTEDQAKAALQHFNSSFIDTSKITVDFAKSLGDESLPRPWSRYSEGSSANDRLKKKKERKAEDLKDRVSKPTEAKDPTETHSINKQKSSTVNEKNKKKRTKALDDLEKDTEFQEFLSVHKHRGSKQTWSNDNVDSGQPEPKESQTRQRKQEIVTANKVPVCTGLLEMKSYIYQFCYPSSAMGMHKVQVSESCDWPIPVSLNSCLVSVNSPLRRGKDWL